MKPGLRAALAVALFISAGAVTVLGLEAYSERQRTTEEINRLRDELYRQRVASDRCRSSLATSQSSLEILGTTIDSIRGVIDSLEALGGGRVPAEQYEEYLVIFENHNDSVEVWEVRSERLLTAESSCRSVIGRHNAISDTLQAVLTQAGIDAG